MGRYPRVSDTDKITKACEGIDFSQLSTEQIQEAINKAKNAYKDELLKQKAEIDAKLNALGD